MVTRRIFGKDFFLTIFEFVLRTPRFEPPVLPKRDGLHTHDGRPLAFLEESLVAPRTTFAPHVVVFSIFFLLPIFVEVPDGDELVPDSEADSFL